MKVTPMLALLGVVTGWSLLAVADGRSPTPRTEGHGRDKRVLALVGQLGDDEFARREAAQKALLAEGPAILPILEKRAPQTDPEVRERLRKLHYDLGGI